jgi:hypothetical protein
MHLRVYSGKTGVIKQLRECDRIDGQPVPMIGLPAVRLIFDVDAAMAVVRIVWFPDLPFPNNTRDIG